jgi:Cu-processing system ATP-binding protein
MASVQLQQIHKSFRSQEVLKGIDLKIDKGGIWTILGPNASGKTTLIKTILGIVIPTAGQIAVDRKNIRGEWEYKNEINYLPQIARFPDNLTVAELFKMIEELRDRKGNLKPLIDRFNINPHLNSKLSDLSGGTKQKVNIVLAFMYENPIYILDEPSAGLDPLALIELKKILQQLKTENRLVIVTTHIISLVEEIADKILFLLEGEIRFSGTPGELKQLHNVNKLEEGIADLLSQNQTVK